MGPQGRVVGSLRVPGSKSLTNRALLIAALAEGSTVVEGALVAEDTEVMAAGLRALGIEVHADGERVSVKGASGAVPASNAELDLRLSGTSIRFLTAMACLGAGRYRLDGNARMRQRPIQDLLDALEGLGADVETEAGTGCPPLVVRGHGGLPGGRARIAGDRSSQFLSALLMVAPYARSEVTLEVVGELQSRPFIDLTLATMADFGIEVDRDAYRTFHVRPGRYRGRTYAVEGDAMAAGYFWAAASVTGGNVRVLNLGRDTRQGDARFAEVLERMGCRVRWDATACTVEGPPVGSLHGGTFDLNAMPDQAQTLAVIGLFASEPVRIENVWNMRIKETDRIEALATELRRLGAEVDVERDGLTVHPLRTPPEGTVQLRTYGDHRMAMALAVAGARLPGIVIQDPGCVAKTYPRFFEDFLALLRGALS